MAEQLYFVRKRGEITGPFSVAQLQSLHARGQFARFSEVSVDRLTWQAATSVPGMFPNTLQGQNAPIVELAEVVGLVEEPELAIVCEPANEDAPDWFYLNNDNVQVGPVPLRELQRLLDAGRVEATTYACKRGMAQWEELASLRELRVPRHGEGQSQPEDASSRRQAKLSRRALLLISVIGAPVVGFFFIVLLVVLALNESNKDREVILFLLGISVFVITVVGTVLLSIVYARHSAQLKRNSGL